MKLSADSLKRELAVASADSSRISLYNKLCATIYSNDPKLASEYLDSSFALIDKYSGMNTYPNNKQFDGPLAEAYNQKAILFYLKGEFAPAIEYFLKALQYYEKYNMEFGIAAAYNNIGSMLMSQKNFPDAMKYYEKAKALKEKVYFRDTANSDNRLALAKSYNNLGSLHATVGKFDEALNFYSQALILYERMNNKRGIALNRNNLGEIYINKKNYAGAEKNFKEALGIFEEIGDFSGLVISLNSLGKCFYETRQDAKAISVLQRAEAICNDNGFMEDLQLTYQFLAMSYKNAGDYRSSVKYLELSKILNDTLMSEAISRQSLEMTEKFESEKKEKKIALLNKDIELQEAINKKNKMLMSIFIVGGIMALLALGATAFAFRTKKKANKKLETLNNEIKHQKDLVDEKQKEILDSIHYAKRIQNSLLATAEFVNEMFPENFIYFQPKDIVSGDFYWGARELPVPGKNGRDLYYLAVCDSTGHGVPGAFMSLLNIGFMSEAIKEKNISEPNQVFNYVKERLVHAISKEGQKDGFDGILICVNKKEQSISYAAANNRPVLIRDQQWEELHTDRMPVGMNERNENFTLHTVSFKKGDTLYLYTDGYADQFGGPKGKKFKYRQLNDLLLANSSLSMNEQREKVKAAFGNWKGELEQVDDVCVIGLRL